METTDGQDAEKQALDTNPTPVVNDDAQMAAIDDKKGQIDESRPDAPQGNTEPLKQYAVPYGQSGPPRQQTTEQEQVETAALKATQAGTAPNYENRPQVVSANTLSSAPATAERPLVNPSAVSKQNIAGMVATAYGPNAASLAPNVAARTNELQKQRLDQNVTPDLTTPRQAMQTLNAGNAPTNAVQPTQQTEQPRQRQQVQQREKPNTIQEAQLNAETAFRARSTAVPGTPEYQRAHQDFIESSAHKYDIQARDWELLHGKNSPKGVADHYEQQSEMFKKVATTTQDPVLKKTAIEHAQLFDEAAKNWKAAALTHGMTQLDAQTRELDRAVTAKDASVQAHQDRVNQIEALAPTWQAIGIDPQIIDQKRMIAKTALAQVKANEFNARIDKSEKQETEQQLKLATDSAIKNKTTGLEFIDASLTALSNTRANILREDPTAERNATAIKSQDAAAISSMDPYQRATATKFAVLSDQHEQLKNQRDQIKNDGEKMLSLNEVLRPSIELALTNGATADEIPKLVKEASKKFVGNYKDLEKLQDEQMELSKKIATETFNLTDSNLTPEGKAAKQMELSALVSNLVLKNSRVAALNAEKNAVLKKNGGTPETAAIVGTVDLPEITKTTLPEKLEESVTKGEWFSSDVKNPPTLSEPQKNSVKKVAEGVLAMKKVLGDLNAQELDADSAKDMFDKAKDSLPASEQSGLDKYRNLITTISNWNPEAAAKVTGLDEETLKEVRHIGNLLK